MEKILKIGMAIMFFLCLLRMPFGYYQFVRLAATVGFSLLAYQSIQNKRVAEGLVFIGLVILFQPLYKFLLGRALWNIVDVFVGVGLLINSKMDIQKKNYVR